MHSQSTPSSQANNPANGHGVQDADLVPLNSQLGSFKEELLKHLKIVSSECSKDVLVTRFTANINYATPTAELKTLISHLHEDARRRKLHTFRRLEYLQQLFDLPKLLAAWEEDVNDYGSYNNVKGVFEIKNRAIVALRNNAKTLEDVNATLNITLADAKEELNRTQTQLRSLGTSSTNTSMAGPSNPSADLENLRRHEEQKPIKEEVLHYKDLFGSLEDARKLFGILGLARTKLIIQLMREDKSQTNSELKQIYHHLIVKLLLDACSTQPKSLKTVFDSTSKAKHLPHASLARISPLLDAQEGLLLGIPLSIKMQTNSTLGNTLKRGGVIQLTNLEVEELHAACEKTRNSQKEAAPPTLPANQPPKVSAALVDLEKKDTPNNTLLWSTQAHLLKELTTLFKGCLDTDITKIIAKATDKPSLVVIYEAIVKLIPLTLKSDAKAHKKLVELKNLFRIDRILSAWEEDLSKHVYEDQIKMEEAIGEKNEAINLLNEAVEQFTNLNETLNKTIIEAKDELNRTQSELNLQQGSASLNVSMAVFAPPTDLAHFRKHPEQKYIGEELSNHQDLFASLDDARKMFGALGFARTRLIIQLMQESKGSCTTELKQTYQEIIGNLLIDACMSKPKNMRAIVDETVRNKNIPPEALRKLSGLIDAKEGLLLEIAPSLKMTMNSTLGNVLRRGKVMTLDQETLQRLNNACEEERNKQNGAAMRQSQTVQ